MQRKQDLPPPGFNVNAWILGRPLLYFPGSIMEHDQNSPSNPAQESLCHRLNHAKSLIRFKLLQDPTPSSKQPFLNTSSS